MLRNDAGRTVLQSFDWYHKSQPVYYCGKFVGQSGYHQACGNCDGRCGPSAGCQCKSCYRLTRNVPRMSALAADASCDQGSSSSTSAAGGRVLVTEDLQWTGKSVLYVYFYPTPSGAALSAERRGEIMTLAREWTTYANIDLEVTGNSTNADIRVSFEDGKGYNSHIGTHCKTCAKNEPTMNLQGHHDKVIPRKVRHEFGHALGLFHEHQLTDTGKLLIPYDEQKVLNEYKISQNWPEWQIRWNVLDPIRKTGLYAEKAGMDQFSVMLYPLRSSNLLTDQGLAQHFPLEESPELSVADKLHIMRMYPGRRPIGTSATSANFRCPKCCQCKGSYPNNPRFEYERGGLCLACSWSGDHKFKCQSCRHVQTIGYQLTSNDTWACRGCNNYTHWRPIFRTPA